MTDPTADVGLTVALRRLALDGRIWILTVLLLGWYGLGTTGGGSEWGALFVPASALAFVYYVSVGQVALVLNTAVGFWLGFVAFYWVVAASVVLSWDWFRASGDGRSG